VNSSGVVVSTRARWRSPCSTQVDTGSLALALLDHRDAVTRLIACPCVKRRRSVRGPAQPDLMTDEKSVTVLGLGAMGSALAGAFLAAGRPVTVWNRTQGKAGELVARGATEATTV
jgi:phosphoglycerate dehydrogenase-like enzyme